MGSSIQKEFQIFSMKTIKEQFFLQKQGIVDSGSKTSLDDHTAGQIGKDLFDEAIARYKSEFCSQSQISIRLILCCYYIAVNSALTSRSVRLTCKQSNAIIQRRHSYRFPIVRHLVAFSYGTNNTKESTH